MNTWLLLNVWIKSHQQLRWVRYQNLIHIRRVTILCIDFFCYDDHRNHVHFFRNWIVTIHNRKLNFSYQIQGPAFFDIKSITVCLLVASRLTCSNSNWSESAVSEGLGRILSLCSCSILIRSNCPITKQRLCKINYSYVAKFSDYINRVMFV